MSADLLDMGEFIVELVRKDIKNIYLRVHPPDGAVRITAPKRMNLDTVRAFAATKLGWIRLQQRRIREQERETPREYVDRESHLVWGQRFLLKVDEVAAAPRVAIEHDALRLQIRPGAGAGMRQAILDAWYRQLVRDALPELIARWEPRIGVHVKGFYVQRMKTRWGSCNIRAATIRLNSELAKKPRPCLEYVVVHELVHLLERRHNDRFYALMDQAMPGWRQHRDELNRQPVRHESWDY